MQANADALEGWWEWEAALDSRTCPTCMPLDHSGGSRATPAGLIGPCIPTAGASACWWIQRTRSSGSGPQRRGDPPRREGPLQADQERQGLQDPHQGEGQAVLPKDHHRHLRHASAALCRRVGHLGNSSNTSLVEAMGPQRAAIFKRELDRLNRDPQQILNWMLTGKTRVNSSGSRLRRLIKKHHYGNKLARVVDGSISNVPLKALHAESQFTQPSMSDTPEQNIQADDAQAQAGGTDAMRSTAQQIQLLEANNRKLLGEKKNARIMEDLQRQISDLQNNLQKAKQAQSGGSRGIQTLWSEATGTVSSLQDELAQKARPSRS